MDEELVEIPEAMPSREETPEPSTPRFFGTLGLGAVGVGTLALTLNNYGPRLVGPTLATFLILLGLAGMLYHAARDPDQLVRRLYLLLAFAFLGAGVALSSIPKDGVFGVYYLPWGLFGLLLGLFFALAGGRHEHQAPWSGLATNFLSLIALAATGVGLVGVALWQPYVPRLAGVALIGLIFWWAAIGRMGLNSDRGYQFGRLLGWIGIGVIVVALIRSALPVVSSSMSRFFIPQGLVLITLGLIALLISLGNCSDRPVVVMTRRELGAYFYSPVAYLVLFGVTVIGWIGFFIFVSNLTEVPNPREPIVRGYAAGFFSAVCVMFVVPVITMRLLSEEKRTGTLEVLLTGPVNEWQVVLSKFVAALLFFLVLAIPWGLFLIPVYVVGRGGFDYLPLLSYYLALVCSGAAFVGMGLFFSSLTRNQIIAAVLTFAGMFLFLSFAFVQDMASLGPIRSVADQLSFYSMWLNALSGQLQVHRLITFVSISIFWLYLTTRVLEARKWS